MQQIKDGRNLEPRVLGDESHSLGESANIDKPVIALNFIGAADFAEAVNIAKTHPGLPTESILKCVRGRILEPSVRLHSNLHRPTPGLSIATKPTSSVPAS